MSNNLQEAKAELKLPPRIALRILPSHPSGRLRACLMLCLFFSAATPHLVAQVSTGDVVGTITDISGAVIPSANVTIRNTNTGVFRTVQTGETGDYTFSLLQVGTLRSHDSGQRLPDLCDQGLDLDGWKPCPRERQDGNRRRE